MRRPWAAWPHGVGGLFGYHALLFAALALAPAAEADLLNHLWPPLIVPLSAALLGLALTRRHVHGGLLGMAGCAVLLGGGIGFASQAGWGQACALLAALVWASYSVLARRFPGVPAGAVAGFCAGTAALAGAAHLLEPTVRPGPGTWRPCSPWARDRSAPLSRRGMWA